MAKLYFASGALYSNEPMQDGKRNGIHEFFYENGTPKTVMPYLDGKLEGEVKLFWPNGVLKRTCTFVSGERVEDKLFNEEGVPLD